MKLGIISDIHGNLEALEAVLKRIEREKVDETVCLGDIVGYGANPNECCALVREHCSTVVLGNHDEWTSQPPDFGKVSESVWHSIQWTMKALLESHRNFLASLPLIVHRENLIFAHAAPVEPHQWHYITDPKSASPYFQYIGKKKCFVGHSHLPGIYNDTNNTDGGVTGAIINIGSVGQPRDGNNKAGFCIYDTMADEPIRIIRLQYDYLKAAGKIIEAGLPPHFAARLSKGF